MKHQKDNFAKPSQNLFQTELVKLLTPNEIRSAKTMFDLLDTNKDGGITENEAHNAYKNFYVCLDDLQNIKQTSE